MKTNNATLPGSGQYFQQIDLLKAVAIIFVVLGHTFTYQYQTQMSAELAASTIPMGAPAVVHGLNFVDIFTHWITYSTLITQQAVPVFIALMAFNFALSYQRRSYNSLKDIYSKSEYARRIRRFITPWGIFYVLALLAGLLIYVFTQTNILKFDVYSFGGYLPIRGNGNYFIAIIFQFLLIFPLIFTAYKKHPAVTLAASYLVALAFEYLVSNTGVFDNMPGLYVNLIIRFLPLITLALYITDDYSLTSKRNRFIIALGILSMAYLGFISQYQNPVRFFGLDFKPWLSSQNLLASFYQVLLIMLGLKILPPICRYISKRLVNAVAYIGRASYHVYLMQIVYFGIVYGVLASLAAKYQRISDLISVHNILICLLALAVCAGAGCGFYYLEQRLSKPRQ